MTIKVHCHFFMKSDDDYLLTLRQNKR